MMSHMWPRRIASDGRVREPNLEEKCDILAESIKLLASAIGPYETGDLPVERTLAKLEQLWSDAA